MRLYFLISITLFFQFATSQNLQYQSFLLDKNLTENANAVVRLDEMIVEISAIDQMLIKQKRVITVLNKKGDKHVHARVWYDNGRKVKNVQAIIYDALGNELDKIKEKDFEDVSAVSGGTLYSDSRVKYMEYTPIKYPYTVEFICEVITDNTGYIPSWYFIDGFMVSVEKSRFEVISNDKVEIVNKEYNFNDKIKNLSKKNHLNYVAENLEAIKYENLSPNFQNITPRLMVAATSFNYEGYIGEGGNWKDIGKWMYDKLLVDRIELPVATKEKAKKMVSGEENPIEKAKIIYKYVQDNTRYISVQEGIGGIQPIHAADVDRVKYGDCKGLTNYTKALLDVVGVESNYARVYASRNNQKSIDENFPTFLGQTNHVILNIPVENSKSVWLECTSQIMPFNFLGDFTDDRNVFVITPKGGIIEKTPSYVNEQNHQKTIASYTINEKGDITGDITISTEGVKYDNRFYLEDRTDDKVIKYYKDHWKNINNLKINNYEFANDRDKIIFTEKVSIAAVNYGTISTDRILFAVNVFNKERNVPDRYRNRKLPFEIQRGYFDEDEFTINLPKNYMVEALPETKTLETEYGIYRVSAELQEDEKSILYKRSFLEKKGSYPKEAYAAYRDFRKEIAGVDNAKIVLKKIN